MAKYKNMLFMFMLSFVMFSCNADQPPEAPDISIEDQFQDQLIISYASFVAVKDLTSQDREWDVYWDNNQEIIHSTSDADGVIRYIDGIRSKNKQITDEEQLRRTLYTYDDIEHIISSTDHTILVQAHPKGIPRTQSGISITEALALGFP